MYYIIKPFNKNINPGGFSMKKKKLFLCICAGICVALIAVILIFIFKDNKESEKSYTHTQVDNAVKPNETLSSEDSSYSNLILHDFETSTEEINEVYNIEILSDNNYMDNTFLENFEIMNNVIDNFFVEDFDKSYIVADFYISDQETIYVNYYDIEKECADEKYNMPSSEFLFGNNTSEGGYMVQINEKLNNIWFSKNELNTILPSGLGYKKVYPYISCIRQVEDVEINLKDGKIKLSEMEERVLSFLNENFPMEVSQNISFGIADVRILDNGDYEGVCFKVRRIYKGIPFEYGSNVSADMYRDELNHDRGEVDYAVSTAPDTMLSFGCVNGTVVETEKITEMISADDAMKILSEKIGENSVYDVYGIELVYRECEIPEERTDEVDAILKPKWKFITINQNDNKYTLFYVDVVTGEITERFEYYYE